MNLGRKAKILMGQHPPEDYLRFINLLLATVAFIWLGCRRVMHNTWYRRVQSTIRNDIWLMAFFWSGALIVGSFEQLFHAGSNVRVVFATAAILVTLKLLLRPQADWGDLRVPPD